MSEGVFPPLADYSPDRWGWRSSLMRHESQAWLVILLSTDCYETNKKKQQQQSTFRKKKNLQLVHSQLPLFFPLCILLQFKRSLRDFSCCSLSPPSGLAIISLGGELYWQSIMAQGFAWGAGSSHFGQQNFPSKDAVDKSSAHLSMLRMLLLHSTNLCQEWPLNSFQNVTLLPAPLHSYEADILLKWGGMKHCRTWREWLLQKKVLSEGGLYCSLSYSL